MKNIVMVVALATVAVFGTIAAGLPTDGTGKQPVSPEQYRILTQQCRYANTVQARRECRIDVSKRYEVGNAPAKLDCRTYSSVTVCGRLTLSAGEQRCVTQSVESGLSPRRAEVECYAFA
ncbi:hypothetical protein [Sphaerisporangium sp. TRM90804]|uniref:hypothetical protein n=1 Tax=Sphaerisporangium sp. TRM90804 TaxID=3031113 RepID=UPI00244AADAF|nr:hypothetical protein [Sphaerisporangium sp. TRM90804]MDH2425219.1 hypothetical protein [Sphaerisporangium sp. TRM90804]